MVGRRLLSIWEAPHLPVKKVGDSPDFVSIFRESDFEALFERLLAALGELRTNPLT